MEPGAVRESTVARRRAVGRRWVAERDRRWWLAVGALTAVALVLRLLSLHESLVGDEVILLGIVDHHSLGSVLDQVRSTEKTPPLHFLLAWAAARTGDPLVGVRIPSLLAGCAAVPLSFVVGRQTIGRGAGLVAAAVMAVSPFAVFYGVDGRAYATVTALVLASTAALLAALGSGRRGWWVAYSIAAAAAMLTHYTAGFVLLAQAGWALWAHPAQRRPLAWATLGAALLWLPWLPGFLDQWRNSGDEAGRIAISSPLSGGVVARLVAKVLVGHPFLGLRAVPGPAACGLLAAAAVVLAGGLGRSAVGGRIRRPSPGAVLIAILAGATLVGLVVYSLQPDRSLLLARNAMVSLPYAALAAGGLIFTTKPGYRAIAAALLVAGLLAGTASSLQPDHRRPDYRGAAAYVDARLAPGDVLADYSRHRDDSLWRYLHDSRPIARTPGQLARALRAAPAGASVWAVVPVVAGVRWPETLGRARRFRAVERRDFPGSLPLQVIRYRELSSPPSGG